MLYTSCATIEHQSELICYIMEVEGKRTWPHYCGILGDGTKQGLVQIHSSLLSILFQCMINKGDAGSLLVTFEGS